MLDFRRRRVDIPKEAKMDELTSLSFLGGGCRRRIPKGAAQRLRILKGPRSGDFFENEDAKRCICYSKLSFGGGRNDRKGQSNGSALLSQLPPRAYRCGPRVYIQTTTGFCRLRQNIKKCTGVRQTLHCFIFS